MNSWSKHFKNLKWPKCSICYNELRYKIENFRKFVTNVTKCEVTWAMYMFILSEMCYITWLHRQPIYLFSNVTKKCYKVLQKHVYCICHIWSVNHVKGISKTEGTVISQVDLQSLYPTGSYFLYQVHIP